MDAQTDARLTALHLKRLPWQIDTRVRALWTALGTQRYQPATPLQMPWLAVQFRWPTTPPMLRFTAAEAMVRFVMRSPFSLKRPGSSPN